MHTLTRALAVGSVAVAVLPAIAQPASAVPRQKGTTTVAPSALTASVLSGLTGSLTVSAVVNDGDRATVFDVGAGGVLTFNATASMAVTGSPTAIAGAEAGVATIDDRR